MGRATAAVVARRRRLRLLQQRLGGVRDRERLVYARAARPALVRVVRSGGDRAGDAGSRRRVMPMDVVLRDASIDDRAELARLLAAYLFEFDGRTEPYPYLDAYWSEAERLPFLIEV